jgi:hypothetical protein
VHDQYSRRSAVFPVCTTNANLNQRRSLSLENPVRSASIGALDLNSDVGWQTYHGLKLAARHRTTNGVSLNATYTLSRCKGTPTTNDFNQTSAGYTNPDDPGVDAGYCDQDRRHLGTLNVGYLTPEIGDGFVGALASDWRLSGILNARSGRRLNITSGRDNAFNGIAAQRPDQILDDIYGPGKDASDLSPGEQIENYFNRDAFAQPAPGTLGNTIRNVAVGPEFWQVDVAISKLVSVATQRLELRLEVFNLFNTFNWGLPGTNFNAANFGRITDQEGDPRILQFGVKYDF